MFTWFRAQCADISFWKVVINAVYTKHVVSILYIHIYMYLKKSLHALDLLGMRPSVFVFTEWEGSTCTRVDPHCGSRLPVGSPETAVRTRIFLSHHLFLDLSFSFA